MLQKGADVRSGSTRESIGKTQIEFRKYGEVELSNYSSKKSNCNGNISLEDSNFKSFQSLSFQHSLRKLINRKLLNEAVEQIFGL